MDPAGAENLRVRLAQQAHWQEAEAVRDGRQPSIDPDSSELVRVESGMRIYAEQVIHGARVRHCKRLIDGVWVSGTIAEPSEVEDEAEARLRLPVATFA